MGKGNKGHRAGHRGEQVGSFKRKNVLQEVSIPISLEQVLLRASSDAAFREALLEDADAALIEWGIELRPSERSMLDAMSRRALEVMILRLDPRKQRNAAFARTVASAVAGSMIAFTATGCLCGGVAPDIYEDADVETDADSPDADGND